MTKKQKSSSNKLIQIFGGVSLVILASSISAYFLIVIPNQEEAKLEFEQKKYEDSMIADLKKECSSYIDQYKNEFTGEFSDPENQSFIYGKDKTATFFEGVYFSKRTNSCVVEAEIVTIHDSAVETSYFPLFVDAATGVPIDYENIRGDFEGKLDTSDRQQLADFLQLVI